MFENSKKDSEQSEMSAEVSNGRQDEERRGKGTR